jgi:hypothetical protein
MSAFDINPFAGRLPRTVTPRRSLAALGVGGLAAAVARSPSSLAKKNHMHKSRDKAKHRCQQQLASCVDQGVSCAGQVEPCATVLTAFCGNTPECANLVNCCTLLGSCDTTGFLTCINQPEISSP